MLKLILGRAGSGKTALIYSEIKGRHERGEKSVMLVPEQYSHDAERTLCERCGNSVCLDAEVLSFTRIASRVFAESGRLSLKTLEPGGRVLLMHLALLSVQDRLEIFSFSRGRTEFLSSLISLYDELRSSRVSADELIKASESLDGTLAGKLRDLALIVSAYDALRPEGYLDPKEKLDLLAEDIADSSFGRDKHIYIDGFTDFTRQELSVLDALMRREPSITVCLTCGELDAGGETQFALTRKTALRLISMAESHGIRTETVVLSGGNENRVRELPFAEREIFSPDGAVYDGENRAVSVFTATGTVGECEAVSAEILRFVREGGLRFRDIAVVSRDYEKYSSALENTLEKYGIPYMTSEKSDILEKSVPAFILGALNVIAADWEENAVFSYLKTGLADMENDEIDELENYVLKWNIRGEKLWTRPEGFSFDPGGFVHEGMEKHPEALERINLYRKKAASPLKLLSDGLAESETASGKAAALYGFLESVSLPETLMKKADALREMDRLKEADEYLRLWEITVSALDLFAGIMGDRIIETGEFASLFRILLGKYEIGTIPPALDRVSIGNLVRVRRRGVKALFLIGASDDSLPKYTSSEGMLSDDDRLTLGEVGIELSEAPESRLSREMGAIYTSVTMPSHKLTVSYLDGTRPSFVASRLTRAFCLDNVKAGDEVKACALLPCFELAVNSDKSEWSASAREFFAGSGIMDDKLRAVIRASEMPRGRLSPMSAEKLYSREINLTASRVDKYHSCRFSYFLQYGLGAKPRQKARFDAPESGTFLHYILEKVSSEVAQKGGFKAVTDEECRLLARKYADKFTEDVLNGLKDKSERFIYLYKRLVRDAETVVSDMAQELRHSEFAPVDFELDFSSGGDVPPAEMSDELVTVKVNGRVDRVDGWIHDGKMYLRIVDYKTGKKKFDLSDIVDGLGMQMLIYLFALQANGDKRYGREIVPAGVMYMPARDVIISAPDRSMTDDKLASELKRAHMRSGLLLSDAEALFAMENSDVPQYIPVKIKKDGSFDESSIADLEKFGKLKKHIEKTLLSMGREIRSGSIAADPYFRSAQDTACMYCDYFEACHFDEKCGDSPRRLKRLKTPDAWERIDWSADGK